MATHTPGIESLLRMIERQSEVVALAQSQLSHAMDVQAVLVRAARAEGVNEADIAGARRRCPPARGSPPRPSESPSPTAGCATPSCPPPRAC